MHNCKDGSQGVGGEEEDMSLCQAKKFRESERKLDLRDAMVELTKRQSNASKETV
jgi:hypothetical protein